MFVCVFSTDDITSSVVLHPIIYSMVGKYTNCEQNKDEEWNFVVCVFFSKQKNKEFYNISQIQAHFHRFLILNMCALLWCSFYFPFHSFSPVAFVFGIPFFKIFKFKRFRLPVPSHSHCLVFFSISLSIQIYAVVCSGIAFSAHSLWSENNEHTTEPHFWIAIPW